MIHYAQPQNSLQRYEPDMEGSACHLNQCLLRFAFPSFCTLLTLRRADDDNQAIPQSQLYPVPYNIPSQTTPSIGHLLVPTSVNVPTKLCCPAPRFNPLAGFHQFPLQFSTACGLLVLLILGAVSASVSTSIPGDPHSAVLWLLLPGAGVSNSSGLVEELCP